MGLIGEASRFCQLFANEIEEHPLLVYYSALPFTPSESIIYKSFHRSHYPRFAGVPPQWSAVLRVFPFRPSHQPLVVAFSPDGQYLAAAGRMGIQVWDVVGGVEILHIPTSNTHRSITFTRDGKSIISDDDEGTLHFWDFACGDRMFSVGSHSRRIEQIVVCPSPDFDLVVSVGEDGRLFLSALMAAPLMIYP